MGKKKSNKSRKSSPSKAPPGSRTSNHGISPNGHSKLTSEAVPHVMDTIMAHSSVQTLLAFRLTCRSLRNRADLVFGCNVGVHMADRDLVFETHGDDDNSTLGGQRIPAFRSRRKIFLEVLPTWDNVNSLMMGHLDHRLTYFNVHEEDAAWFANFLDSIEVLDLHGEMSATLKPGDGHRDGPDADGRVIVKGVKVPKLQLHPSENEKVKTSYATAVPFYADTVVLFADLHLRKDLKASVFYWPRWIPDCKIVIHDVRLPSGHRFDQGDSVVRQVRRLEYPATVRYVSLVLWVEPHRKKRKSAIERTTAFPDAMSTPTNTGHVTPHTLTMLMQRFCGAYTPEITWAFHRLDALTVVGDEILDDLRIPAKHVPDVVLALLAACVAVRDQKRDEPDKGEPPSDDDVENKVSEIEPHVMFIGSKEFDS